MQPRERTIAWDDPVAAAARGEGLSGLEYMHAIAAGEIPPPPIAVLLGFALEEVEEGRAVFAVTPQEFHYNPIGVVHGGLAATLLDSAMGCAVHSTLPAGVGYTTLEFKVNFARAITGDTGRVVCEGTLDPPRPDGRDRRGPRDRRGHGQAARPRHHNLPAVRHKRHLRGSDPLALGRVRGSDPPYTRAGGRQLAGRLGCAVQRLLPACVRRRRACRGDRGAGAGGGAACGVSRGRRPARRAVRLRPPRGAAGARGLQGRRGRPLAGADRRGAAARRRASAGRSSSAPTTAICRSPTRASTRRSTCSRRSATSVTKRTRARWRRSAACCAPAAGC